MGIHWEIDASDFDSIFVASLKNFAPKKQKKNPASKVAHNPTTPRVLTPASIWLCGTETVF